MNPNVYFLNRKEKETFNVKFKDIILARIKDLQADLRAATTDRSICSIKKALENNRKLLGSGSEG